MADFGWLWKRNKNTSGESATHWRERLCFIRKGNLGYMSEKTGKPELVCHLVDLHAVSRASFPEAGHENAFILEFQPQVRFLPSGEKVEVPISLDAPSKREGQPPQECSYAWLSARVVDVWCPATEEDATPAAAQILDKLVCAYHVKITQEGHHHQGRLVAVVRRTRRHTSRRRSPWLPHGTRRGWLL